MSIFGKIASAIFGKAEAAESAVAQSTRPGSAMSTAGKAEVKAHPISRDQVETMIQKIADGSDRHEYNWKQSIVDLMKLLGLDSSLAARKELAQELGYSEALDGSAEMNVWLHRQVIEKLMESGGSVPDSLK